MSMTPAEEAKQSALYIAEDEYNLSSGWCDGLSKGSQDLIKSICYGVILGGIDLPVRQPSVEQDGADAVAEFKYMVGNLLLLLSMSKITAGLNVKIDCQVNTNTY